MLDNIRKPKPEREEWIVEPLRNDKGFDEGYMYKDKLIRCKDCKWLRYCETEEMETYLDCDHPDGGGLPRNEDWFCADGERSRRLRTSNRADGTRYAL